MLLFPGNHDTAASWLYVLDTRSHHCIPFRVRQSQISADIQACPHEPTAPQTSRRKPATGVPNQDQARTRLRETPGPQHATGHSPFHHQEHWDAGPRSPPNAANSALDRVVYDAGTLGRWIVNVGVRASCGEVGSAGSSRFQAWTATQRRSGYRPFDIDSNPGSEGLGCRLTKFRISMAE